MERTILRKEKNSGQILVEVAGYRPLPVLIKSLEVAGEQLAMRRASEFVYGDWTDEEEKVADAEYFDPDVDSQLDSYQQLLLNPPKESVVDGGRGASKQSGEVTPESPAPSETE